MRIGILLSLLILVGCGSSPERRAMQKRAFLSQTKAFAASTAKPRLRALAKSGDDECDAAVDPVLQQAKAAVGDLDGAQDGANQTLNASTGNAAMVAALLAAAAAQQQNGTPATTSPTTQPVRGAIQGSVVDPVAAAPAPAVGTGGFGDNAPSLGGGKHDPVVGGTTGGGDSTVAHGGGGGHDTITGGAGGGGSGGSSDTIVGGTGHATNGGGARDAIVGGVATAHVESVRTNVGSLGTDEGGGGGGSGGGFTPFHSSTPDELLPPSALGRGPASATRVAGLANAADVATLHGPGIFSLTTQTYSRFCQRKNLAVCLGQGR